MYASPESGEIFSLEDWIHDHNMDTYFEDNFEDWGFDSLIPLRKVTENEIEKGNCYEKTIDGKDTYWVEYDGN